MILVVGGGSVGLLLAASWGVRTPVALLTRTRAQARCINRSGIALCGLARRTVRVRAAATVDRSVPALLRAANAVVVCVKTYDTEAALRPFRVILPAKCPVLTVQNGLHPERAAVRALGRPVVRGIVTAGAVRLSPNRVRVRWTGRGVVPGEFRGTLQALFATSGAEIPVRAADDFDRRVWGKFAINCVINAVGTLADVPNGEVWSRPQLRRLGMRVLRELSEVFPEMRRYSDVGARMLREVCTRTATNINSTLQDIWRGAPLTEVAEFNGAVVAAARRRHLEAPVNEALAALVASRAAAAVRLKRA